MNGAVGIAAALLLLDGARPRRAGRAPPRARPGAGGLGPELGLLAILLEELGRELLALGLEQGRRSSSTRSPGRPRSPSRARRSGAAPPICTRPAESPEELLPQERAHLVAHQPVEDPSRLLRVDLVPVDARVGLRRASSTAFLRDLVEHGPRMTRSDDARAPPPRARRWPRPRDRGRSPGRRSRLSWRPRAARAPPSASCGSSRRSGRSRARRRRRASSGAGPGRARPTPSRRSRPPRTS